jgi:hypothetical protein
MVRVTSPEEPLRSVEPLWWIVLGSLLAGAVLCGGAALILSRRPVDDGLGQGVLLLSIAGLVIVLACMAISYAVLGLVLGFLDRRDRRP